ncbi:MAG: LacI family DNA-binding transcriptional regulator [Phyllobacterium sp.]
MSSSRPRPNLSDIASALGVSIATVSNAMSGKGRVSVEMIEKIRATAAEFGYKPSLTGRALRTGRSGVLGLALANIAHPLFPQIAQAVEFAAANNGYGILIADSRGDVAAQTDAINRLIERGVDGLVVVPRRGTRIVEVGRPVAVIDSPSTPGNTVAADHWNGGQQIARHLAALGHRRFMIVGANPNSNVQNDRIGGIRSALSPDMVSHVIWIEEIENHHFKGCDLGLAEKVKQGFTAFAATSDLHALRILMELQRNGISVPREASVTGFDDLAWSSVVTPGLTTMHMDMPAIAEIAVTSVLEAIGARRNTAIASVSSVPMQIVIRKSSGEAPLRTIPREGALLS